MGQKFDAIIIRTINYSDTSLIVKCYTAQRGVQSFIAKGVKSKRKAHSIGLMQHLSNVELISASKNPNAELKILGEIKTKIHYKTLYSDPVKSGVIIFIAEIMDKVLKEEESNKLLFDFLENSILYLDRLDKFANFHLAFLIELSKYLGFYPLIEDSNSDDFDLENGMFYKSMTTNTNLEYKNSVELFKKFLGTKFVESSTIDIKRDDRNKLVDLLLSYYENQINGFKKPKSLEILKMLY